MTAPDETEIRTLLDTYLDRWRRHEMERWGALFTENADFISHAGLWWRSRAENVAGHRDIPAGVIAQKAAYRFDGIRIQALAANVALVHATWSWPGFVDPAGGRAADRGGIIAMVLVRQPEGWRIRASQNTRTA